MKYVIGNWKMFPKKIDTAIELLENIKTVSKKAKSQQVEVVVCPPMPFLSLLGKKFGTAIQFGAQDVSAYSHEARTGSVSVSHITSSYGSHVILGHSEMRSVGETSEHVAKKLQAAVSGGLKVILCVGEKEQSTDGAGFLEVEKQLRECLKDFPTTKFAQLIVVYEPVWAVGVHATSSALPREFEEMSMLIRRVLAEHLGKVKAFRIPLLYGGSVDTKNISAYLEISDGVLVGRKSLQQKDFLKIIECAVEHVVC